MPEKKEEKAAAERIADAIASIPEGKQGEVISYVEGVVAGVGIAEAAKEKEGG